MNVQTSIFQPFQLILEDWQGHCNQLMPCLSVRAHWANADVGFGQGVFERAVRGRGKGACACCGSLLHTGIVHGQCPHTTASARERLRPTHRGRPAYRHAHRCSPPPRRCSAARSGPAAVCGGCPVPGGHRHRCCGAHRACTHTPATRRGGEGKPKASCGFLICTQASQVAGCTATRTDAADPPYLSEVG